MLTGIDHDLLAYSEATENSTPLRDYDQHLIEDVCLPFVLIAVSHLTAILKKTNFRDTLFACRVMLFGFCFLLFFFLPKSTLSKNYLLNTISECQKVWIQSPVQVQIWSV